MRILIAGGAGYVGSHIARECLRAGHEPVVFDSYISGHRRAVEGLLEFEGDLGDRASIRSVLANSSLDAVFHLATCGPFPPLATRSPSKREPAAFFRNNVVGTINLLSEMIDAGVRRLVVGSTAAVYGEPVELPVKETHPVRPLNDYGRSMLAVERRVAETARKHGVRYMALRAFSVGGADPLGDIGQTNEQRLIPRLLLTALERYDSFEIHGTGHDTPDGTCVRDFVHVNDVARAWICALENLEDCSGETINLGSSRGCSVGQVVEMVRRYVDDPLAVTFARRRPGSPGKLISSTRKARSLLGWQPEASSLDTILQSAWAWHRQHPWGYTTPGAGLEDEIGKHP